MLDYIFIIGPSAVGKSTLARELYQHYDGVYFEQNMVPEFTIPADVEDVGIYEEQLCWDNVLLQLKFFHDQGRRHIVALDFDDLRTRELPLLFRGYRFVTLKLISSDPEQIRQQMEIRHATGMGLYAPDQVIRSNHVISARPLLPNEILIDVAGKSAEEVYTEAIQIIDGFEPMLEYVYELDDEKKYLSWVQSRNLR